MKHQPSPSILQRILQFQRDELTSSILYEYIAGRQKDEGNRTALLEIAKAERSHYKTWKGYTGQELRPNMLKIFFYKIIHMLLGDTFTIKLFEIGETFGAQELREIEGEIPEARTIMKEEEEHEDRLMEMVDEERLHYIGSMVLGLNDALVELTGTIAGLTFALMNTRLVALSGIITGVSATLSMAASNYLAERADGNAKALKSSFYTGMAYLVTVALMVLPYLLLPNSLPGGVCHPAGCGGDDHRRVQLLRLGSAVNPLLAALRGDGNHQPERRGDLLRNRPARKAAARDRDINKLNVSRSKRKKLRLPEAIFFMKRGE